MNQPYTFLPFLFSFLFLSIVEPALSLPWIQGTTYYCGNLTITHPFRLKSDPFESGNPKYELNCENNITYLEIFKPEKYIVTRIDYYKFLATYDSEIDIVASSVANGDCIIPSVSPSPSMQEKTYRGYYLSIYTWGTFMKCTEAISNSSYISVPCISKNGTFVYFVSGYDAYQVKYLEKSCSYLASVPFNYYDDDSSSDDTKEDAFKLLQLGFTLTVEGPRLISIILVYAITVGICVLVRMILARLMLMPLVILAYLAYLLRRSKIPIDKIEKFLRNQQNLMPTRYSYTDLIAMTGHFREKLGQGGFGSVFKGVLPGNILVAVKMLGNSKCNGDEFINEVSTLGRIYHRNVVRLVGFCSEGSNRALVYEYMPGGSLDKYIFINNNNNTNIDLHIVITLEKLNEIALGIARGIDYLHRGCDMQILHFDIKPNNILLDANFIPKIADFGLAKLYPKEYSLVHVSAARGTIGYIAPELVSRSFGAISQKSDVYSFGMLLMEMVGGQRNTDPRVDRSSQVYYPSWMYDKLSRQHVNEINEVCDTSETERKLCLVGLWCIQMKPSDRPTMSKVIEMLEAIVDTIEIPPSPFFASEGPYMMELDISYSTVDRTLDNTTTELESMCFEIDQVNMV